MAYHNSIRLGASSPSSLGSPADVKAAYLAHGVQAVQDTIDTWSMQVLKGGVSWDAFTAQLTAAYGPPKSQMPGDPTSASIIAAYKAHNVQPAPQTVLDWIRSFDAGTTWSDFLAALTTAYGPPVSALPSGPTTITINSTPGITPKTIAYIIGGIALLRALR